MRRLPGFRATGVTNRYSINLPRAAGTRKTNAPVLITNRERPPLLPGFRLLIIALVGIIAAVSSSRADEAADRATFAALSAARTGDWNQAYAQAVASHDPLAQKIVNWLDYTRTNPGEIGR